MTAPPASWIIEGTWPTGRLAGDAPAAVAHVVTAVRHVSDHTATDEEAKKLMAEADVSAAELFDFLTGATWPTLDLLVRLEVAIGRSLW